MKIKDKYLDFLVFILPMISIIFIFRSVIFTDSVPYNSDVLFNFYPYFSYYSNNLPLIIQSIFSGFPGFVTVSGIWFNPLNWLLLPLFKSIYVYKYLTVVNIFFTYIFTYLYARKIKFTHEIAVFVASIFVFSGQLMLWADTLILTSCFFLLPLSFYLFEIMLQKKGATKFLVGFLCGVVLGFGWLSSQPQFVFYQHLFFIIYTLFRTKEYWIPFMVMLVSFLVGFKQIIASLGFKVETSRSLGVSVGEYFMGAYMPQDIIHFFLPFFSISPRVLTLGSPNLYIGIFPVILLVFAFVLRRKIVNKYFSFFSITFIFCLLASIKYSPIGYFLNALPIFDGFREAPRIMYIGQFSSAIIAGFSLDYILVYKQDVQSLLQKSINIIKKIFFFIFLPVVICVSLVKVFFFDQVLNFANSYFLKNVYINTSQLSLEYYNQAIRSEVQALFNQLSASNHSVLALSVSILTTLFLLSSIKQKTIKCIAIFSICFVLVDFSLVYAFYYKTVPIDTYLSEPESVKFIHNREKDNKDPFRVYSLLPNDTVYREQIRCLNHDSSQVLALQKELIVPNLNILYNLDSIDGYDQFVSSDVSRFIATLGSERSPTGPTLALEKISPEQKIEKISSKKKLLQTMNVKYVVSHYAIQDKDFTLVYEGEVGDCKTKVLIYELNGYFPRYYITGEGGKIPVPVMLSEKEMTFLVDSASTTNLYIGNAFLRDWRAFVNDKEVQILKVNEIYMAVPIEKGLNSVRIIYEIPKYNSLFNFLPSL